MCSKVAASTFMHRRRLTGLDQGPIRRLIPRCAYGVLALVVDQLCRKQSAISVYVLPMWSN
jgi:hypothetical protein